MLALLADLRFFQNTSFFKLSTESVKVIVGHGCHEVLFQIRVCKEAVITSELRAQVTGARAFDEQKLSRLKNKRFCCL